MTVAVTAEMVVHGERPSALLRTDDEMLYVTETTTGLVFAENTPVEVWGPLTERLIHQHKRIEWAIGDALQFGERRYGDTYTAWAHETGLSENTLATIKWVAGKIESSRRREDVGWSHHREAAALDVPEDQDAVLDEAADQGMTRHELRERVKKVKQERKRAERAIVAAAPPLSPDVDILVGDARSLDLYDESVDLIVTSPPYALSKAYHGGDICADIWQAFMRAWLIEAYRVTRSGGRLAVNVPLDTSPEYGSRPTYAETLTAALAAGWTYRSTIVWHDDQLGKSTARGSLDSASSPYIYFPGEMILLMYKGDEWGRPDPEHRGFLDHQHWLDWTNGHWEVSGESSPWEDHPAPFPLEIPRRLIDLLSFSGDLVLDPFVGSGTTALAAFKAGRRFYGVDASEEYVESAKRRLAR
jgi:site-specific DNA-methyltransferase (adenine-specific)